MRLYTKQHPAYGGIDLHARSLSVCILHQEGASMVPRNMQARPETVLQAIAPSRDAIVVAVACVCTWYWLADLGAQDGLPCVLGHALSMQAIQGGTANNDTLDAHKRAVWLRGGMRPHASVSPAAMRATRDLLRRRMSLTRQRAELRAPIPHTNRQSNLPERGKKLADTANRDGVAERCPAPAVPKSRDVDLTLLGSYAPLLRALEWPIVTAAQEHDAHPLSRLQTVPGLGNILRLVLLDASHEIERFPSVPEVVSSCRLVKCATASAGTRSGTGGTKIGPASRTWALAEAAGLLLRDHPAGHTSLTSLENNHGQGTALTRLAQQLGRAVSDRFKRQKACDMDRFLQA